MLANLNHFKSVLPDPFLVSCPDESTYYDVLTSVTTIGGPWKARRHEVFCQKESAARKIILSPSMASRRQSGLFHVRMLAREV